MSFEPYFRSRATQEEFLLLHRLVFCSCSFLSLCSSSARTTMHDRFQAEFLGGKDFRISPTLFGMRNSIQGRSDSSSRRSSTRMQLEPSLRTWPFTLSRQWVSPRVLKPRCLSH